MELRRGGVGSQAVGRRMDGDSRDGGGGGGCKDGGSEDYENLPTSASLSTHMTAGAMAGILEHSVMYPVDSVKTRMQSLNPDPKAQYTSVYGALKKIIRTEGFWRPLRGLNVMVMGAGPAHALYFACYENMKRTLNAVFHHQGNSHLANGIAGSMATLLHDAVMNPAEVVKQRMQMYNSPHRSALSCVWTVWRTEGLGAFYRSYTTQLTMNIPFQSIHFITYEFLQEQVNPHRGYNPQSHIISGGLAGALAAAATTPLDVCKTLLNTQENMALNLANISGRLSGMANAFRMVYQLNGLPGYFKGMQARVIYQMPSTAISWSVYEFFKYFLTKHKLENRTPY
ncbi:mitoferrin-1 isoform X1 [Leopardus geoffroyi]|uniref:Mitoferrin-1 n=1 Tax=Acinonyx jubatus TaxID=32536 RepID=A0A6J2AY86_ACIJB|nr:mitoferrin-1 isoform X2 [Acinonyx jubatus]XP_040346190.1 mitoferrin-1 isoform X1 [Puma yagouaroundi]XP_045312907.1 mitoferrin-1 isoform X1 [Leopardus geoffroyi]